MQKYTADQHGHAFSISTHTDGDIHAQIQTKLDLNIWNPTHLISSMFLEHMDALTIGRATGSNCSAVMGSHAGDL